MPSLEGRDNRLQGDLSVRPDFLRVFMGGLSKASSLQAGWAVISLGTVNTWSPMGKRPIVLRQSQSLSLDREKDFPSSNPQFLLPAAPLLSLQLS